VLDRRLRGLRRQDARLVAPLPADAAAIAARDPAAWLWRGAEAFHLQREASARAREAVARVLARRRPLAGGELEFLALHRWLADMDAAAPARALADPYAHFWTRLAFDLTRAALAGSGLPRSAAALGRALASDDPARLLAEHLAQFKRLALGAALAAGAKLELAAPLVARLPLALPGADAALEGEGRVSIRGVADGRLLADDGSPLVPAPCPVARAAGVALPLQPYAFHVPGFDWTPPAAGSGLAFQASRVPSVERALELAALHAPDTLAWLPELLRFAAVNPIAPGQALNYASHSDYPGAFVMLALDRPHVLGAAFVHEGHHNRLFCLEELAPILAGDRLGTDDDAVHYSPWREEPRPLRGILHAVYVSVPEGRYWLDVLRRGDAELRPYAAARCARTGALLAIGVRQLERFARFTPVGDAIFARLAEDAREAAADLRRHADPRRTPLLEVAFDGSIGPALDPAGGRAITVRERILEHVARFDRARQVSPELLAELDLA
jgi:HEXXH motif-containing protein